MSTSERNFLYIFSKKLNFLFFANKGLHVGAFFAILTGNVRI